MVGTVRQAEDRPHLEEQYIVSGQLYVDEQLYLKKHQQFCCFFWKLPDRQQLLLLLMTCDVVIYDISQDAEQLEEATWALTGDT